MDIVLEWRERVCGYRGTVSSADLDRPMCLCPVNLPDSSGHRIGHALSVTEPPPLPSALAALTGQDPGAPHPWHLPTPGIMGKAKAENDQRKTPAVCSWGWDRTSFKSIVSPGSHTLKPWDKWQRGQAYPYLSPLNKEGTGRSEVPGAQVSPGLCLADSGSDKMRGKIPGLFLGNSVRQTKKCPWHYLFFFK